MKPKHLLSDYLIGRFSGEELRTWLAKDISREARETLAILNVDDSCHKALLDFIPPPDAPERLADKVGTVEFWVESAYQADESEPSKSWLSRLIPALDVAGHSKPGKSQRKRKKPVTHKNGNKPATRKKTRPPKKHSTRSKKKT